MLVEDLCCDIFRPFVLGCLDWSCTLLTRDQRCRKQKVDYSFPPCCTSVGIGSISALNAQGCPEAMHPYLSLYEAGSLLCCVSWKRARETTSASPVLVRHKFLPGDVEQSLLLGDCWLLATMAALAEIPGALRPLILEREMTANARYHVQIFDGSSESWQVVVVDTLVPVLWHPQGCDKDTNHSCCAYTPVSMAAKDGCLWPGSHS